MGLPKRWCVRKMRDHAQTAISFRNVACRRNVQIMHKRGIKWTQYAPFINLLLFFSGKTLDWLNANVIYFMETGSPGPGYFNLKPIVKPSLSVRATDI